MVCVCGFGSPTGLVCPVFFQGSCREKIGGIARSTEEPLVWAVWMVAGNARLQAKMAVEF